MDKDLRKIIQALIAQGFDVTRTKKGHWQVFLDGIWVTTLPKTVGDWRAIRNALAAAKRAGFQWPP